ncbi:MAG: COX15/CtaA family protein [Gammaproteobacteria bacterium]|nr:cytochrome B [Gammaproteobacteria bacterium]
MSNLFVWLARFGCALALIVVTVGAWVRLTDAGLGCPDWPGCYGEIFVTESLTIPPDVEAQYGRPLDAGKAWREMFHRYLASTLGLVCVTLAVLAWLNRKDPEQPRVIPFMLAGLVVFQGLLGMWTVTLLLKPLIVVAHLLGGLATLSLLFWLARGRARPLDASPRLKVLAVAAAAALVLQIALGGWTSANYAALACPDFPTCQTQWWPELADFDEAFVLWRGIGIDYEGGVLDHPARVAVHFTHRLGAIVASLLLLAFAVALLRRPDGRIAGGAVLAALAAQLALGVSIVVFGVPLSIAVAHNGGAAVLLLTIVNAHKRLFGF